MGRGSVGPRPRPRNSAGGGLFDLAEDIPGPSTEAFSKLAKSTGTVIIASLFEKRAKGVYHNTAVVFDADEDLDIPDFLKG